MFLFRSTEQKFGTDVNAWIEWLAANESKYVRWSKVPPQAAEPWLIGEYRWLMEHGAWYRCLNRIQPPQLSPPKVNVPRLVGSLTYLDKIVAEVSPRRRQQLADCLPSLRKMLEQRGQWILNDASEKSQYGPAEEELVAFWLQRAITHWGGDNAGGGN